MRCLHLSRKEHLMTRRIAFLLSVTTVSGLLLSCGKSKEEEPVAAAPVGPPAAVMAEIAEWKAIGGATDLRDLAPKPAAPGTRNAADLHRPLIDILEGMSETDQNLIHDAIESPTNSLKYVIESYEKELATIKGAAALPYCDWGTNFEDGQQALMPHLKYSRSAARLLVADARVKADAGDYDGAADSILSLLHLSEQIGREPVVISMLLKGAMDVMAAEAIREMLKNQPAASQPLLETLSKRNYRADLRRTLLAEGAMIISSYVELAGGKTTTPVAEQSMSDAIADGLVGDLRMMRVFIEQTNRPQYQRTAAADAQPLPSGARIPDLHMDVEMLNRLCNTSASFENIINEAVVALQLREYKSERGEYPDPATFKVPEDVFTGESMAYVRNEDGFTLRVRQSPPNGGATEQVWDW